jgi:hypothetical protein
VWGASLVVWLLYTQRDGIYKNKKITKITDSSDKDVHISAHLQHNSLDMSIGVEECFEQLS